MNSRRANFERAGLFEALAVVRARLVANRWLQLTAAALNAVCVALLAALAFAHSTRGPLRAGLWAAAAGMAAAGIVAWCTKPSAYALAQELDRASRSGDRLSTAVHFWNVPEPSEIVLRQRADALEHIARLEPAALFAVRAPGKVWRTGVLLAAVAAFGAYRAWFGPPLSAIGERIASSRAVAAMAAPWQRAAEIARAEKKELAGLLERPASEGPAAEKRETGASGIPGNPSDASRAAAQPAALNAPGGAPAAGANTGQPGPSAANAPAASNGGGLPPQGESAEAANAQAAGQSASSQGSIMNRALQALENLMSSAMGSQNGGSQSVAPPSSANAASTQPAAGGAQGASTASQSSQGQTGNPQQGDAQAAASPGKHTGAGNAASPWQDREAHDGLNPADTAQQHVQLQATGYRGPIGKERPDVAPGTAQTPLQNVAPQAVTTVNGTGQDSVPPRYRQYVQNYFQRGEKQP